MSERTDDPTFQDYTTLTPDKDENFTFGGHMYHTTSDGQMYLHDSEIPFGQVEVAPESSRDIMASRKADAFMNERDKPVPIENPEKLEGTSDYNVIRAEKQGDTEYHYVDKLPTRPYTDQEIQEHANFAGRVGGAVTGAITKAATGAGLAKWLGPEAVPLGAGLGAVYGGIQGYRQGANTMMEGVNTLKDNGFTPTKTIDREGNKIFIEQTPPREF